MEIIKHGNKNTKKTNDVKYEITCNHCGCVFRINFNEFTKIERTPNGNRYYNCPECNVEDSINPMSSNFEIIEEE